MVDMTEIIMCRNDFTHLNLETEEANQKVTLNVWQNFIKVPTNLSCVLGFYRETDSSCIRFSLAGDSHQVSQRKPLIRYLSPMYRYTHADTLF